jgi:membrane-bound lytic murein transglycosylase MltF
MVYHHLHSRTSVIAGVSTLVPLVLMLLFPGTAPATDLKRIAPLLSAEWTTDLDTMRKRGVIRVLVTYKKTEYFVVNGQQRGFEYELMEQFERAINKGDKKGQLHIDVVYIPVPFENLIPSLIRGRGDIAAAGLTITTERQTKVAFTIPYVRNVNEVVVTHKSDDSIRSLDDLSGRILYVLSGSSYVQHLTELAQRLKDGGKPPVYIVESDAYLATEDILELVNAGIVDITVADDHIAKLWANVLPDIKVHEKIAVNTSGQIAWAVRKNNPELRATLNDFLRSHRKGTKLGNVLFKRYYENTRWIKNPLSETAQKKLERYNALFKKYADEYEFDWLLIAALAFQESGLNPKKKSHRGAVGLMQIRPSTAKDKHVRIKDIYELENNVHAGVKYLAFLRDRYFTSPEIQEGASIHFSLAAYNAGPARVRKMRARAKKMGLDPNIWFRNVEQAAQQIVGSETTRYVANVYKYYLAYTLLKNLDDNKTNALKAQTQ